MTRAWSESDQSCKPENVVQVVSMTHFFTCSQGIIAQYMHTQHMYIQHIYKFVYSSKHTHTHSNFIGRSLNFSRFPGSLVSWYSEFSLLQWNLAIPNGSGNRNVCTNYQPTSRSVQAPFTVHWHLIVTSLAVKCSPTMTRWAEEASYGNCRGSPSVLGETVRDLEGQNMLQVRSFTDSCGLSWYGVMNWSRTEVVLLGCVKSKELGSSLSGWIPFLATLWTLSLCVRRK